MRLVDVGRAKRAYAILHHAAAVAVHDADRQVRIEAFAGDDLIRAVLAEEAGPALDLPVVDRLCVGGKEVLDRLAHRYSPISAR